MSFSQKLSYLARSISNTGQEKKCPYCGQKKFREIDRKYFVTALLKCENCGLNHRHPKDEEAWLKKFYESEYSIETHMMTKLPPDEEIAKLKRENFPTLRSYDIYINALVRKPVSIIDYGCSWGYNVYKLAQSGYTASGYELSASRAAFGTKKLDVPVFSDLAQLPRENDMVMSSHTIEHLSDIKEFVTFSKEHLTTDGLFMTFCPNGNDEYRKREPGIWHVNWGALHPNYLDVEFAQHMFKNNPYLILTGDWEFDPAEIAAWDGISQKTGARLDGKELLIISKPNIEINPTVTKYG